MFRSTLIVRTHVGWPARDGRENGSVQTGLRRTRRVLSFNVVTWRNRKPVMRAGSVLSRTVSVRRGGPG